MTEFGLRFTNVFSSDLERAHKTANAICLAQADRCGEDAEDSVKVETLSMLREQDFGVYEGKPFSARHQKSSKDAVSERGIQIQRRDQDEDDDKVESKESMKKRAEAFIDEHLVPIISRTIDDDTLAVAIVSHGILLNHLWRSFLRLLPMNSVTLSPGVAVGRGNGSTLEYIGGWSNTGYLELDLQRGESTSADQEEPDDVRQRTLSNPATSLQATKMTTSETIIAKIRVTIMTINGKDHLIGLKRTRGGVGSSKQEVGQTSIEAFFKKRKI